MIKTLEWTDAGVRLIDQTKLPLEETYVTCKTYEEVADAIRTMIVRGAPAIGVTAAMGVALGVRDSQAKSHAELKRDFDRICEVLAATRPTAVNLFWAIGRMRDKFEQVSTQPIARIQQELVTEAQRMMVEDIAANEAMGRHGAVPTHGLVGGDIFHHHALRFGHQFLLNPRNRLGADLFKLVAHAANRPEEIDRGRASGSED